MGNRAKIVGFDLLRIWLSVEVVFDHYWAGRCEGNPVSRFFGTAAAIAVPCFIVMTFLLTDSHFRSSDAPWLKRRFGRLLLPYLFWPVVAYLIFFFGVHYSPTFVESNLKLTTFAYYKTQMIAPITDLFWQWAFGSSRRNLMQFWFHFDLIALTAFFFLFFKVIAARLRAHALAIVFVVGLVMQYAGLTERFFGWMPFECRYSLGRLAPMAVLAVLGFAFSSLRGSFAGLKDSTRWFISLLGFALVLFTYIYNPFSGVKSTIGYHGLARAAYAVGVVTMFYFMPLDRLPEKVQGWLSLLARYCMGIYCIHFMLGWLLYAYVFPAVGVGRGTLVSNLLIWAVSWVICHLVSLIPGKWSKALVQ